MFPARNPSSFPGRYPTTELGFKETSVVDARKQYDLPASSYEMIPRAWRWIWPVDRLAVPSIVRIEPSN